MGYQLDEIIRAIAAEIITEAEGKELVNQFVYFQLKISKIQNKLYKSLQNQNVPAGIPT